MTGTTWRAEWNAISARIEGLVRSGEFFFRSATSANFLTNASRVLTSQSAELICCLKSYGDKYANALPEQAKKCLDSFVSDPIPRGDGANVNAPQLRLMKLSVFRSQFEFLLAGIQEQIRSTTERAFEHLQRCIVADETYKDRWRKAYDGGEPSCEKLGGVHLLWHGIWAFKCTDPGQRTDLVLGNRIDNPSTVEQTALGMVLTEWKRATSKSKIDACYAAGKKQAACYGHGIVGGIELADTRYIVVITRKAGMRDLTSVEGDITYRFINIDVEPETPSRAAERKG